MVKILKRAYLIIMLLFIYLPILILAVYSFTSATQIGAIRGFSLQNYVTLFTTPELTDMIRGTLLLALGSAAIATVLGTLGAIGACSGNTGRDRSILFREKGLHTDRFTEPGPRSQRGCRDRFLHLYSAGGSISHQQGYIYTSGGRPCDIVRTFCVLVRHAQDQADGFEYLRGGAGSGRDAAHGSVRDRDPADRARHCLRIRACDHSVTG